MPKGASNSRLETNRTSLHQTQGVPNSPKCCNDHLNSQPLWAVMSADTPVKGSEAVSWLRVDLVNSASDDQTDDDADDDRNDELHQQPSSSPLLASLHDCRTQLVHLRRLVWKT